MSLTIIFSFAMSFVYLGIGIFLIIREPLFYFSNLHQLGLGTILVVYAAARFYMTLKKKRESEIEENEE